jgi:hypothetical protein
MAIASLLLGLLGITIIGAVLSIIFGFVALAQIRRTRQRGRGLAIAGMLFSVGWLVFVFVAPVASFLFSTAKSPGHGASGGQTSPATPGASSPAVAGGQSVNVFALRPGQCFQNPPDSQTVLGVTYVTVVPCTTPHNAQAFVQFNATGSSYPGAAALRQQADHGCHAKITGNVQTSKVKPTMTLHYLYPLQASWDQGHRTITCLIVNSKPNLKSSLLKAHPKG